MRIVMGLRCDFLRRENNDPIQIPPIPELIPNLVSVPSQCSTAPGFSPFLPSWILANGSLSIFIKFYYN